jgi:hypothetical protein
LRRRSSLSLLAFVSSQEAALVLLGVVGVGLTMVDVAAVKLLQRSAAGDLLPHALGRSDLDLLRLERGLFLATVTGSSASADAAEAVVGSRLGARAGLAVV